MASPGSGEDRDVYPTKDALEAPRTRKSRRYGFACSRCKARKVRCSGDQPVCQNCQRFGDSCHWPSQSSTQSQLRDANSRIRDLEASIRDSMASSQRQEEGVQSANTAPTTSERRCPMMSNSGPTPSASPEDARTNSSLWFQVGIGQDGSLTYNGPTSRFHAGTLNEGVGNERQDSDQDILAAQYSVIDSVWMPLIFSQPVMRGAGVSREIGMALLDIYWTWLHPLHNCVYKPLMIMDLAFGGPYCSDFLLMCIFGLVGRHLSKHHPNFPDIGNGNEFLSRAKELLLQELSASKPSIPTIQGLLILGGRQSAMGNSSEGWLYTGMAIRMMEDIGLHLDITSLAKIERWTAAEKETRKRLYNSAYIWDKTLSLALGRSPSLTRAPYATDEILDKFDDEPPWRPVHAFEVVEPFPPSPIMNSSTFCAFCRIHEITTDMMLLFATPPGHDEFISKVGALDSRFQRWYDELSVVVLKISNPDSMAQSPPPHIVSLNLLYHTLRILIRRPFFASSDLLQRDHYLSDCEIHLRQIFAIHSLYSRTFPHRLMTYQVSYCIFIAASTEVQELSIASTKVRREEAAMRLAAAVKLLQNEAMHTPGIGRSLDTIRRLMCMGAKPGGNSERMESLNSSRVINTRQISQMSSGHDSESRVTQSGQDTQGLPSGNENLTPVTPRFPSENNTANTDTFSSLINTTTGFDMTDDFWPAWMDTGAGFHPEVMSWGWIENSQRAQGPAFGDQNWM
ncbi:unnamed protein product [Clonostachys rhizophaga]|uniref:Zn(2)-C6 fungal-type domain-containing protein n=1 Tax=Clonostachys rhizophaga TaxID=160324 RepID=A0A9N9VBB9_9HYPO|nr:unnamed protein product [Clonostachys rhizophaga]